MSGRKCLWLVGFIWTPILAFLPACKQTVAPATPAPPAAKSEPHLETAPLPVNAEWLTLFDGKTLRGWVVTDFAGAGEAKTSNEKLILQMGDTLTGVTWTNGALPTVDYEVSLEAMKIEGNDFFCALTFPVGESHCTWVIGGWGGGIVGLSSIDGMDASENETSKSLYFERNRWFHLRLTVQRDHIRASIDQETVIDADIKGRKISMRAGEIYKSQPFGFCTYQTTAALRNIKLRRLSP